MRWSRNGQSKLSHVVMLLSMAIVVLFIYQHLKEDTAALTKTWDSHQDFSDCSYGEPLTMGVIRTPSGSIVLEQVDNQFEAIGTILLNFNAASVAKFKKLDLTTIEEEGVTNIKARLRTAPTEADLYNSAFSSYYDDFPVDLYIPNNQWLQLEIQLETTDLNQTPVLQDGSLTYVSEKDDDPRRKFFPAPHPKNQKIKLTSTGKPQLNWDRLNGKDAENLFNYIILKGFENYPVYGHPIAILPKSASSYIDNDVDPETRYRYFVRTMGEFNQTDDNRVLLEITTPEAPPEEVYSPPPLRLSADIKPIPIKVFALTNNKIAQDIENEAKTLYSDYFTRFQSAYLADRVNKIQKNSSDSNKVAESLKSKGITANKNRYSRLEIWQTGKDRSLITSRVVKLNELGIGETKLYLKPGVYDSALYIPGSLRKISRYQSLDSNSNIINFTEDNDSYLVLGDFTGDGKINSLDFSYLAKRWSSNEQSVDLNFDGIVNALDFAVIYKNWNKTDNF